MTGGPDRPSRLGRDLRLPRDLWVPAMLFSRPRRGDALAGAGTVAGAAAGAEAAVIMG